MVLITFNVLSKGLPDRTLDGNDDSLFDSRRNICCYQMFTCAQIIVIKGMLLRNKNQIIIHSYLACLCFSLAVDDWQHRIYCKIYRSLKKFDHMLFCQIHSHAIAPIDADSFFVSIVQSLEKPAADAPLVVPAPIVPVSVALIPVVPLPFFLLYPCPSSLSLAGLEKL